MFGVDPLMIEEVSPRAGSVRGPVVMGIGTVTFHDFPHLPSIQSFRRRDTALGGTFEERDGGVQ